MRNLRKGEQLSKKATFSNQYRIKVCQNSAQFRQALIHGKPGISCINIYYLSKRK